MKMKLIKCEGPITTVNGRSFRKPCVGEVIPEGHLRSHDNKREVFLSGGCKIALDNTDLVEVPTPIGEPFELHGSWWQEIEPCLLDTSTIVLRWSFDKQTADAVSMHYLFGTPYNHLAIPCDAPAVQTRPMTWGEAWDRDLWIKDINNIIAHSCTFPYDIDDTIDDADIKVSKSHRGPWFPAVMPWEGE
jgi:hypothetical protein